MKKIAAGITFILLSTLYSSVSAAEVEVTLRLERLEATLVDTILMEVRVSGSRDSDATPVLHGLEEFLVKRGGTSSRVEIINGKVSTGLTYTYFIQPQKTGTFEIGPAEIKVGGENWRVTASSWWSTPRPSNPAPLVARCLSRLRLHLLTFMSRSRCFTF